MRFIVQVRIEPDPTTSDATADSGTVVEVAVVDRDELSTATLGLAIAEAKAILAGVKDTIVAEQCDTALAKARCCDACGRGFAHKDRRSLVVRTLYGKMSVASPRWWTCPCRGDGRRSAFTPLAGLLPDRSTPELGLIEATFAAHMPYGAVGRVLGQLVPVGRVVHGNEPRRQVHAYGERLDGELGDDLRSFITERPTAQMPRPDMPLTVTIDGGYVHSSEQTSRRDGWFQAVCGTVTRADGRVRRFGFIPNIDTHPRRRIHDTLLAQGLQPNQLVTFLRRRPRSRRVD